MSPIPVTVSKPTTETDKQVQIKPVDANMQPFNAARVSNAMQFSSVRFRRPIVLLFWRSVLLLFRSSSQLFESLMIVGHGTHSLCIVNSFATQLFRNMWLISFSLQNNHQRCDGIFLLFFSSTDDGDGVRFGLGFLTTPFLSLLKGRLKEGWGAHSRARAPARPATKKPGALFMLAAPV